MKIGLQIPDFTWPGGPSRLGTELAEVVRTADSAGFDRIAVMDHVFQIGGVTDVWKIAPLEAIGSDVIPAVANLGR